MYTSFLNHDEFKKILKESVDDIDIFFENNTDTILVKNKGITSSLVQRYAYYKNNKIQNAIIKPILLDAAMRSETLSGGAGDICLNISSKMLSNKNSVSLSIPDIEKTILNYSKRASRLDFNNLIEKNSTCNSHVEIFSFLFKKMNISSPIFVERSKLSKTRITLDSGFKFDISVDKKYLSQKTRKMLNVKCFVIDGFIESVSEIHHILDEAARTKENYVIFSRHIADDVQSTIEYNVKRGTLNLVPVTVGFDENTLNILNDISMCTNADLISSHKGDVISQSIRKDPVIIESIEFLKDSLSIINKSPSDLMKSHIKYLKDKRETSSDPSIFNIIENRIKSLSSGKIVVSIGTDLISKEPRTIEIFDKILREMRAIIKSGVVYIEEIEDDSEIKNISLNISYPYSPLSLIVALRNSHSVFNSLKSIHGVIYEDEFCP